MRAPRKLVVFPLVLAAVVLLVSSSLVAAAGAPPSDAIGPVEVSAAIHHDVSPPLRNIPSAPSAANLRERPLRAIPSPGGPNASDPALQTAAGPALATTAGLGFAGVGEGDYSFSVQYAPPDTNGAVGATQYVQWVNTYFAVFDKTTGAIAAGFPKAGNTLWSGFGGGCEANNDGDPIVQYDKLANRWVMTQFSVSTKPYLQCVAVSQTSDATGSYYRYAFNYGNTQFPDYPKLGVWPDGYYVSYNIFNNGVSFAGSKVCAFDRNQMLAGAAATQQCFQLSNSYGGLLPADLDGTTPPPAGSPNYLLNFGSNSLNLWKFSVNWVTPTSSTLAGPTNIPVDAFSRACGGSNCIPQPGTTQKLDSLADRLMYRLAYRNFGDHESLAVNHSVTAGNSVGVRWYELRNPGTAPTVYQQSTFAPDSNYRWMGSIAQDKQGNMALGYSVSGTSLYPSIRYTGRLATDTLDTMAAESVIKDGAGSQQANLSRWGDYSSMSVDPTDDCTFWYTTEYLKTNGTWNWSTQIASFSFPGCSTTSTTAPVPPTNLTATAASSSQINLAWTDNSTNESGFTIERSTDGGATWPTAVTLGANTTIYSDTGLTASTLYTYRVYAYNSAGNSAYSNTANATTLPAPPSAPSNLAAAAASSTQINLSWTDTSTNEDGFTVQRTASNTTSWTTVGSVGANITSFQDTGLSPSTTYAYRVAAYNSAGTSGYSNTASATTVASAPPAAPSSLTATATSSSQINLSWSETTSSPADGFYVERSPDSASWSQIATVAGGSSTSYSDSGLAASTTYYYQVRAYNSAGTSSYSNTASTTTQAPVTTPNAPTGLTAIAVSSTTINLSWSETTPPSVDSYYVERSQDATTWSQIASFSGALPASYQDTNLSKNTRYYYRVRAHNTSGFSPYSNVANAKTRSR